jgi:hypothetical protein
MGLGIVIAILVGVFSIVGYSVLTVVYARRIRELERELAEYLDPAFRQIASRQPDGWWDTMALSTAFHLGERLVEMGLWERMAGGGISRRQFYRPIDQGA